MNATGLTALIIAALATSGCSAKASTDFTDRAPLASCGELVLGQGETIPLNARSCMETAARDSGAELSVTSLTTEGDPIVTYYRVGPMIDGVEMFVDGTADSFGSGEWTRQNCPGEPLINEYGACAP